MRIKGIDLNARQRQLVLAAYVHRWTHENAAQTYGGECPGCVQAGPFPLVTGPKGARSVWECEEWHAYHRSLESDAEWLARYAFYFVADGSRLESGRHYCEPLYLTEAAG